MRRISRQNDRTWKEFGKDSEEKEGSYSVKGSQVSSMFECAMLHFPNLGSPFLVLVAMTAQLCYTSLLS